MVGLSSLGTTRRKYLTYVIGTIVVMVMFLGLMVTDLRAQGEEDIIIACASPNGVRLVDDENECRASEELVQWNAQGPEGPAGPQGPSGPPGATDVNINVSEDGGVAQPLNGFIKFDGVNGDATEEAFAGWSRILAVDHEVINTSTFGPGGGGGAGVASFAPVTVVKELDSAMAALFQAVPSGEHFSSVHIVLVDQTEGGLHNFYQYELENVIIKRYNFGETNPQTGRPLETLDLIFERITVSYTPINADGTPGTSVSASWNIVQNAP